MRTTTYVLLGALAIVMVVAFLIELPTEREDATYALPDIQLALDPARVVRVEIARGGSSVVLERSGREWEVTQPVRHPANMSAVNDLLSGFAQARLTGLVSSNPAKQALFHVNDRGTRIVFTTDDGSTIPIVVGKESPRPHQTFVRPASSTSVYLAYGITPGSVNRELRDWRDRVVYRTNPNTIDRLTVRTGDQTHILQRSASTWTVDGNVIPRSIIGPVLTSLGTLEAADFYDEKEIVNRWRLLQIEVGGRDPVRLDFYGRSLRSGEVLVRSSRSGAVSILSPSSTESLPPLLDYIEALSFTPPPVAEPVREPRRTEAILVPQEPPRQEQRPAETVLVPQAVPEAQPAAAIDDGDLTVHLVRRGETLESIARKYNVSPDRIKQWNLLERGSVASGMELYIFVPRKK